MKLPISRQPVIIWPRRTSVDGNDCLLYRTNEIHNIDNMKDDILKAIDQASEWLEIDGVEGVAEGEKGGERCITVLVSVPPSKITVEIPSNFLGYPVIFDESGIITAQ